MNNEIKFISNAYVYYTRYVGILAVCFGFFLIIFSLMSNPQLSHFGSFRLGIFILLVGGYLIINSIKNDIQVSLREDIVVYRNSFSEKIINIPYTAIQKIEEKTMGQQLLIYFGEPKPVVLPKTIVLEDSSEAGKVMYQDYIYLKKILSERAKKKIEETL